MYGVAVVPASDASRAGGASDLGGDEPVVGTARIVGDGGSIYHLCDVVVPPTTSAGASGGG